VASSNPSGAARHRFFTCTALFNNKHRMSSPMFKETTHLTVMLFAAAVVLVASTETWATHQRHQRPNKQPRLDERPAGVAAAGWWRASPTTGAVNSVFGDGPRARKLWVHQGAVSPFSLAKSHATSPRDAPL
jgi:hypothetical protein